MNISEGLQGYARRAANAALRRLAGGRPTPPQAEDTTPRTAPAARRERMTPTFGTAPAEHDDAASRHAATPAEPAYDTTAATAATHDAAAAHDADAPEAVEPAAHDEAAADAATADTGTAPHDEAAPVGPAPSPDELPGLIEQAQQAESRQDRVEALRLWAALRGHFPDRWITWSGEARMLRDLGRLADAETLLHAAAAQFPQDPGPRHDLARLAERRRDWPAAEHAWRGFLELDTKNWVAYTGLATALREQGQVDAAEALLLEQQREFPHEVWLFVDHAQIAETRRDWSVALERWSAIRERFPQLWFAYTGEARVLRQLDRHAESAAQLQQARERFPHEGGPLHDLARLAEQRRDWPAAEQAWREFLAVDTRNWAAHTGLAAALRAQGRSAEAEAVLLEQQPAFPKELALFADYAQIAEDRRDWPAALERWNAARQAFPDRWVPYTGEARILIALNRPDEAEALLRMAVQRFPGEGGPRHDLARLAERRRDWASAEQAWRDFLEVDPRPWFAHAGLAAALREQGRAAEAETSLLAQQQAFPNEAWPFAEYARIAETRGDWPAALERWSAVRARFPDQWDGYRGGAVALRDLGRVDEARDLLQAACEQFPGNAGARHDLARLAERQQDWTAAETAWRAFLTVDPHAWFAHAGLAAALRAQGRVPEAEALLLEHQQNSPHEPWPFIEHALSAEAQRDWTTALDRWAAMRERFPDHWRSYVGSGAALRELGRLEAAEALLQEAHTRFPQESGPPHDLARLAERRRDWAAAEHWWRAYLALEQRHAFAYGDLATALREQGRFEEAQAELQRAHERFPDHAGLMRALADSYRRAGDVQQAVRFLDEVTERRPDDTTILVTRLQIARESADWQRILELTERFRGNPPPGSHLVEVGRTRVEALIATGDLAEAANEFEALAAVHSGEIGVVELAADLAMQLRDLDWTRRCWQHLLAAPGSRHRGHLGAASVALFRNFHAMPGSEVLIHWLLTQETPPDRAEWVPPGILQLAQLLNAAAGGPLTTSYGPAVEMLPRNEPADGEPDVTASFLAAYAMLDPASINPLVRALLGPWADYQPPLPEYMQIIEQILRRTNEGDWPRNVFLHLLLLRKNHPDVAARPAATVAALAETLVESGEFLRPEHASGLLLLLMGADMFSKPVYRAILQTLRQNDAWLPAEPDTATPAGLLRNLLHKTFEHPPAVIGTPRPLRIALDISGHLRGYKAAHATWRNLRLDGHEVHIAVYCNRKVGNRSLTDFGHLRTLPPNLGRAFDAGILERGWPFMHNQYAEFSRELAAAGEAVVTEEYIREFYGAEAAIVVDEDQPDLASRDRVWRMYRGMYLVHQLATDALPECDLHVRLRPDYGIRNGLDPDWWDLFVRSRRDRTVFADTGRSVRMGQDFMMGDQFALGTRECMDSYSRTFVDVGLSQAGKFFRHSPIWNPHESVALSTFYDGVAVAPLSDYGVGGTMNTPTPSVTELYDALVRQMGGEPRHDVDTRLLEALRIDQANEGKD